jgi:hypothetical protein
VQLRTVGQPAAPWPAAATDRRDLLIAKTFYD